jgi:uncharacterized membrane protein YkvA (DUF1232 family)
VSEDREEAEERSGTVKEALLFVPNVAKLAARLAKDRRTPRSVKWSLAAFGLYLASPVDLIPDWLPIVGYLDDLVLIAWVGGWIVRRIPAPLVQEHWDGTLSFSDSMGVIVRGARESLPEKLRRKLLKENP